MRHSGMQIWLLLVFVSLSLAMAWSRPQSSRKAKATKSAATAQNISEGEKRFRANCGRCHQPPEDISPREAKAVVRQMRVRAMLSAEDERLILEYIAP